MQLRLLLAAQLGALICPVTWGTAIEAVGFSPAIGLRGLSSRASSHRADVVPSCPLLAGAASFALGSAACRPSSAGLGASSPTLEERHPRVVGVPPVGCLGVGVLVVG